MKQGEVPGVQGETSVEPRLATSHHSSGFRRRLAGFATFVSLVAAACGVGGDKTPAATTLPVNTPGTTVPAFSPETPGPTLAVSPSKTPRPTPETLAFTPTPVTRAGFLSDIQQGGAALDKYNVPITVDQLRTAYVAFMENPADAKFVTESGAFNDFLDTTQPTNVRQAFGAEITNDALKAVDATQDPPAKTFASMLTDYDISTSGLFTDAKSLQLLALVIQS